MKRLNRKGFTLVELLAVIVILAIVVGITLVTVLPTLKKSRQEAFELTAQTAADYLEKQYQLYVIGETATIPTGLQTAFSSLNFTTTDASGAVVPSANSQPKSFDTTLISNAGLKPENYVAGTWYIVQSSGRVCVTLTSSTNTTATAGVTNMATTPVAEAGEYYDATETGSESFTVGGTSVSVQVSTAKSSACS